MPGVAPSDVYVAATVDQGGNVVNACRSRGVPTLLCRAHRINSSVMWSIGVAGSEKTCKNIPGRKTICQCAGLVGVFSPSAVNNDALRAIQQKLLEQCTPDLLDAAAAAVALDLDPNGDASAVDDGGDDSDESAGASESPSVSRVGRKKLDVLNTIHRNDTR